MPEDPFVIRLFVDHIHARLPHHVKWLDDEEIQHIAELVTDGIDAHCFERSELAQEKAVGEIQHEHGEIGKHQWASKHEQLP